MVINALIFLSEITKLGLLYLAIDYNLNSTATLIFCWLIWEFMSSILLGKFSDTKGRKLVLIITISSSVLVSILGRSRDLFIPSLFIDGILASATLPIAFAAKNDQNPTKSKRLTYAEAYQYRALPWILLPLAFLLLGSPKDFWNHALLISSLLSFGLLFFLKDEKDKDHYKYQEKSDAKVFTALIIIFLLSFFVSESAYQTGAYMVEESKDSLPLTKSYILFGFGVFITSSLHKVIGKIPKISLSNMCGIVFFSTAAYFFIKFLSFSWEDQGSSLNYAEKAILGAASGLYIPLIYALVCDRFKVHQQGILCGVLEATTTLAEIISPLIAFLFIRLHFPANIVFLIIGFGFYLSYSIIRGSRGFYITLIRKLLRIK